VDCGDFDLQRSLEHSYRWLQPVAVAFSVSPAGEDPVPENLRPLGRAAERIVSCASARASAQLSSKAFCHLLAWYSQ